MSNLKADEDLIIQKVLDSRNTISKVQQQMLILQKSYAQMSQQDMDLKRVMAFQFQEFSGLIGQCFNQIQQLSSSIDQRLEMARKQNADSVAEWQEAVDLRKDLTSMERYMRDQIRDEVSAVYGRVKSDASNMDERLSMRNEDLSVKMQRLIDTVDQRMYQQNQAIDAKFSKFDGDIANIGKRLSAIEAKQRSVELTLKDQEDLQQGLISAIGIIQATISMVQKSKKLP